MKTLSKVHPLMATVAAALVCLGALSESVGARQVPQAEPPEATPTEFEVASLKLLPQPVPGFVIPKITPGRFGYDFAGFTTLVAQAFNWRYQANQIVEGPGYAEALRLVHFELQAKTGLPPLPSSEAWDAIRPMFLKLLVDRFNFKFHTEMKEMRAYALVQTRAGAKGLTRIDEDDAVLQVLTGVGEAQYKASPLQVLCNVLAARLRGPVVNETGLDGRYDFAVRWIGPDGQRLAESTILREQLGLELAEVRRPVEILVIDHAEMPTPE